MSDSSAQHVHYAFGRIGRSLARSGFLLILLASCAAPPTGTPQRPPMEDYRAGEAALAQGEFSQARQLFSNALANARRAELGPEAESQILIVLGRVYGNLCQHDEAEKSLTEAATLVANAFGERSSRTFAAQLELARFSYDVGRHAKSVKYFEQALPLGAEQLEALEPAVYAAVMRDYAGALARIGRSAHAQEALAKARAAQNRTGVTRMSRGGVPYQRYPAKCQ